MKTPIKLRSTSFLRNIAVAIFLTALIAGCGKETPQVFPVEGGYIDLKNVSSITTCGFLALWGKGLKNESGKVESYGYGNGKTTEETWVLGSERGGPEPLTKASIEKAKRIIRENKDADINTVKMGGYISFDDNDVMLPELESFESYKDLLSILDSWAEVLDQLPIQ